MNNIEYRNMSSQIIKTNLLVMVLLDYQAINYQAMSYYITCVTMSLDNPILSNLPYHRNV